MQPKFLLVFVLGIFIAVFGTAVLLHIQPAPAAVAENSTGTTSALTTTASAPATNPPAAQAGYTLTEVQTHSDASSCWVAIGGKVYDVTHWINQHPGGPEHILAICGTDATAAFTAQHEGQREPAQELATFFIGPLAE